MYSHNNQLTWGTHDEPNEVYNREIKRRLEQWKGAENMELLHIVWNWICLLNATPNMLLYVWSQL